MSNVLQEIYLGSTGLYLLDPRHPNYWSGEPSWGEPPPPPSYYAGITGEDLVPSGRTCYWSAWTNIDDAQVQWLVNGSPAGTSTSFERSSSSSFSLDVHFWNTDLGASAWEGLSVEVVQDEELSCDAM